MDNEWIVKQLGSVNQFIDEATATRFAAEAKTLLLMSINVTAGKDPETGNWVVVQSLKYLTSEGEQSYALPVVSVSRQ